MWISLLIVNVVVSLFPGGMAAPGVNGPVYALAADTSGVYVAGSFSSASGTAAANVALWDGTLWHALGGGINGTVRAIVVDNGDVFVGGAFTLAGSASVGGLAKWDGAGWSDVGGGVGGASSQVKSLVLDATGLLVGGVFSHVGASTPANGLARWTGSVWEVLGGIPPGIDHDIRAIVLLKDKIYVGGVLLFPGTSRPSEATLARATPFVLSDHAGSANADDECTGCASVDALATDGSSLFVAGAFTRLGQIVAVGSPYEVAELLGGTLPVGLGDGVTAPGVVGGGAIRALAVFGDDLYVGGVVGQIRGTLVNNIARWNGSAWSPLGGGVDKPVHALVIWNGSIHAGGEFLTAGGSTVNHVARWDGADWSSLQTNSTPVETRSWGALKGAYR